MRWAFLLFKSLAVTYFHMGTPTLSSALSRFTSEFGMESGGTNSLWPPGISIALLTSINANKANMRKTSLYI